MEQATCDFRILTKEVLASIPVLVQRAGVKFQNHGSHLGCKVSTLRVRCSQAQISLRVPQEVKVVPLVPGGEAAQAAQAEAVLCLCRADHTATQQSCDVPAAPAGGSHAGQERSRACHEAA